MCCQSYQGLLQYPFNELVKDATRNKEKDHHGHHGMGTPSPAVLYALSPIIEPQPASLSSLSVGVVPVSRCGGAHPGISTAFLVSTGSDQTGLEEEWLPRET